MSFNPAGDSLALHQASQHGRGRRPAIPLRRVSATSFPARGGGDARKPDDAIPKAECFAIKNPNVRRLGRNRAIRGGRAEKIGRQAKTKGQRGNQRACNTQPRTAKAGTVLPSLKDTSWFTHT